MRAPPASAAPAREAWRGGGGHGPGWRAWRRRDDAVTRPERLTLAGALVKIENHRGLGGEVRVAGEDPGLVLPGLDRVLSQDPQHRGWRDRAGQPGLGDLGGQFRPGP